MGGFYTSFRGMLQKYGLDVPYVALVLLYFIIVWTPFHLNEWFLIWGFLLACAPFVLPVLFFYLLRNAWVEYKQQEDYWSTEYTTLEIRLPEEITQSPYAAELFMRVLYQTGEVDTELHALRGKTKPWFSLEIASTEGAVRFYVWTRSRYKEIIKSQMYAHYPTVQVVEVPDYTLAFPLDLDTMDVWGVEQRLQKADPYPIMTYVAWGLDKASEKEEFKVDPLNSLLEFMGSIGPGEHIWAQIILRGHTECYWSTEKEETHYHAVNIHEWTVAETEKIGKKYSDKNADGKTIPNYAKLGEGDKQALKAMQMKEFKQMFDVGMRTMYLAKKENKQPRNSGIPTAYRSFEHGSSGLGLNGFKPIFYIGPLDWPWQDFMGLRKKRLKTQFYQGYVTRQYFYPPNKDFHIALNTEELASIWHLPGKVAHTPTLQRMPSRRAEAPANLPI